MPRGFGRGFRAWGPYGWGGYPFWGWGGRGFEFPWLPRWRWAMPYAASYAATIPYYGMPYGYGLGYGYTPGYGYPAPAAAPPPTGMSPPIT